MSGMSNACARQRSSGHLAVLVWSTAKAGGAMLFRDESRGKPEWVGVNASEHLSFARLRKASRGKPRRKPESTCRDRRGASVNVVMVGSDLPADRAALRNYSRPEIINLPSLRLETRKGNQFRYSPQVRLPVRA